MQQPQKAPKHTSALQTPDRKSLEQQLEKSTFPASPKAAVILSPSHAACKPPAAQHAAGTIPCTTGATATCSASKVHSSGGDVAQSAIQISAADAHPAGAAMSRLYDVGLSDRVLLNHPQGLPNHGEPNSHETRARCMHKTLQCRSAMTWKAAVAVRHANISIPCVCHEHAHFIVYAPYHAVPHSICH